MSLRIKGEFRGYDKRGSFNMTPIIDIVFLLIIFFSVVCQFVEAEKFPISVPDGCESALSDDESGGQVATVTVMKTAEERVAFAVGPEIISAQDYFGRAGIVEPLARLIDIRLRDLPGESRVVTLRIDKDVRFADAQYALAAVAQSTATDVQLAVLRGQPAKPQ